MEKSFHLSYCTKSPSLPATCFTSPFLKEWNARHRLTCGYHGEIAHAWQGLDFGSDVHHVYTDLECTICHEHYVELSVFNQEKG